MNSLEIARLQNENKILRIKIDELYKSWLFDSERYKDLKEKYEDLKLGVIGGKVYDEKVLFIQNY